MLDGGTDGNPKLEYSSLAWVSTSTEVRTEKYHPISAMRISMLK
jgi:hypothetical protein